MLPMYAYLLSTVCMALTSALLLVANVGPWLLLPESQNLGYVL